MNLSYQGMQPQIDPSVYVAPGAAIVGDVVIGRDSSIWFGTVVRADVHYIRIGTRTNIQDLCVLHVTGGTYPLVMGHGITVGHRAIVHGCTVGDGCLIGMGAVLLDGCQIGSEAIVAAGSVVAEGSMIPAGTLAMGVPARPRREVSEKELQRARYAAEHYVELAKIYRKEHGSGA
ncbi:MAG: gamma carbonic anhydrase family protein [Deltaproteobacteria bacterium]|nr:gamma carbonic anhydrase family protein [Deltaproteobacteria bacterium]MBW2071214.1 gamma carbonic anhydrase family protein [Deltaproteobacteria bacterium]